MLNVSIMGDSLSTYEGYNPEGYAVFYDTAHLAQNGMNNVKDTWWAQVILALGGQLCVNNSYSGSRVSGKSFPAACCLERIESLQTKLVQPDVILVYIGVNDWGNGVAVSGKGLKGLLLSDVLCFSDAYLKMLSTMKEHYPHARIICGTLMRSCIRGEEWDFPERYGGISLEEYNNVIRKISLRQGCELADISSIGLLYETLDGTHATAKGHTTLADAWLCRIQAGFATWDGYLCNASGGKILQWRKGEKTQVQVLLKPDKNVFLEGFEKNWESSSVGEAQYLGMCRAVNDRATQKTMLKIKFLGYGAYEINDSIRVLMEEQRAVFLCDEQLIALLEMRGDEQEWSSNVGKPWCNMTIRNGVAEELQLGIMAFWYLKF